VFNGGVTGGFQTRTMPYMVKFIPVNADFTYGMIRSVVLRVGLDAYSFEWVPICNITRTRRFIATEG
jgi:hypothetical protein